MEPEHPASVSVGSLVHPASLVVMVKGMSTTSVQFFVDLPGVLSGDSSAVPDLVAVASGAEESQPMPVSVSVGVLRHPQHLFPVVGNEQMAVQFVTPLFGIPVVSVVSRFPVTDA